MAQVQDKEKQNKKLDRIIKEILDTEKRYLSILEKCAKYYMTPLRRNIPCWFLARRVLGYEMEMV